MDPEHLNSILALATGLLRQTTADDSPLKPTDFFNEGWMTALTLAVVNDAQNPLDLPPFSVAQGGHWWHEAGLRSPFPREGTTWADAVLGHFDRRTKTKRGIQFRTDATQFNVIEAKLHAKLSAKTTNDPDFDQAVRTVANMANELASAGVEASQLTSVRFSVIAPAECVETHRALVARESIERKVRARMDGYNEPCRSAMERWYEGPFRRLLDAIQLECLTWEAVIGQVERLAPDRGQVLAAFYQQCRYLARLRDREE